MPPSAGPKLAAGLEQAVAVNEAAKEIRDRSFHVSVLALDALVKSRGGSDAIRGFSEVARQMRSWATSLQGATDRLVQVCEGTVTGASRLLKHGRAHLLITRALAQVEARGALAEVEVRLAEQLTALRRDTLLRERELGARIDELVQLGKMACVLSRSAMIEAAKADSGLRESVTLVAREFYDNGERVLQVAKSLRNRMEAR